MRAKLRRPVSPPQVSDGLFCLAHVDTGFGMDRPLDGHRFLVGSVSISAMSGLIGRDIGVRDRLPPTGGILAAQAADPRHMVAVGADPFAAFATGGAGLVSGEFVGGPLFVSRSAALA